MQPFLAFSDQADLPSEVALNLRRERGFTLIEVLVTVFILCLGLLGVGALQYLSIKSNQSALSRTVATEYAYQMLDFIRSYPGVTMTELGDLNPKCTDNDAWCKPNSFDLKTDENDGIANGTFSEGSINAWRKGLLKQLRQDLGPDATMSVCRSDTADVSSMDSNALKDCGNYTPFDAASDNKYYVVVVQSEAAGKRVAADSGSDEPLQVVVVGEVL